MELKPVTLENRCEICASHEYMSTDWMDKHIENQGCTAGSEKP